MLFCGSCLCYQNGKGNTDGEKTGKWGGQHPQAERRTLGGALHGGRRPNRRRGKPIAKSVLARTQRECKEESSKRRWRRIEKIDVTKRRDYTVGGWAELWYENYAKPSVRASTAAYYKNYIDRHIVPRIGDIKLTALTTLQLQKLYNETKAHGRVQRYENMGDLSLASNKTIRGLHTMLRQCLEQAVTEQSEIPCNPANGCRLPKKEKKKMPELTRAGEDSGLPESGGGMGRPADVLSGTEYRLAARGAGGAAVERPQLADEDAGSCPNPCRAARANWS